MKPPETPISSILAVIHGRPGRWACVAGTPLPGERFRVLDLTIIERKEELQNWVTQINAGTVRVVLPASETICRTSVLPEGDRDSLEESLGLQAETQLLGTAPPHRMGMTVIPAGERDVARTGLVMAWPESSPFRGPDLTPTPLYVPDVCGLMSIVGTTRPADPVIWIDPTNSSLALALTHMQGIQVRALREEFSTTDTGALVSAAVAETALQAGLSVERARSLAEQAVKSLRTTGSQFILPDDVAASMDARLEMDAPLDQTARDDFGIALGCLLATGDDYVATTIFRETLPEIKPSVIEATSQQLSSARVATWLLVASLILLLFVPVVISGTRLGLLRLSHPSLAERVQESERQERRYRMYRVLNGEAWPMTKLLADLSNSTPEGIELEQVRLGHGEPVKITGKATHPDSSQDARELVAQMKADLEATRVFKDVVIRYDAQETFGPRNFSIDAQVSRPLYRPRYAPETDFGVRTLAHRLYGDNAVEVATGSANDRPRTAAGAGLSSPPSAAPPAAPIPPPPAPATPVTASRAPDPPTVPGSPRRSTRRPSGAGGGGATRADSDARGGNSGATPAGRIPVMLTAEQMGAMTDTQIRAHLVEVSKARKISRKDPELDKQLGEQFNLLFEVLQSRKPNNEP